MILEKLDDIWEKTVDKRTGSGSGHHKIQGRKDVPSNISLAQMLWIVRFLDLFEHYEWYIHIFLGVKRVTLPKTNIAPENRPWEKETIVFQPSIFRCENVSFRVGICLLYCWDTFTSDAQAAMPNRMACDVFALAALLRRWRTGSFWIFVELVDTCTYTLPETNIAPKNGWLEY